MALKDYVDWLKATAGATSAVLQKSGNAFSGGTITTVDLGGGNDPAFQFVGRAQATTPSYTVDPATAGKGATIAIRFAYGAYDATDVFAWLFGWTAGAIGTASGSAPASGLAAGQGGGSGGNQPLRARYFSGNPDTVTLANPPAIGTPVTLVIRFKPNYSGGTTDRVEVFWGGNTAQVIDYTSNGITGQVATATLNNLFIGSIGSTLRVSDFVQWAEDLSDADCIALADTGIRTTLEALPSAPTFAGPNITSISTTAGTSGSLDVSGRFSGTGTRTYGKGGTWPSWLTLDAYTGVISWAPAAGTAPSTTTGLTVTCTTSGGTATSDSFSAVVDAALAVPSFGTQPSAANVSAGGNATFTAAATGNPSPTLQWQSSPDGSTWTNISGQTTGTLTLAGVTVSDSGKHYRCVATNSQGSTNSNAVQLTVNGVAPTITQQPQSQSVVTGNAAPLTVTATNAATYQWQSSTDGTTWADISGATTASYTTPTLTTADTGKQYRVKVTSSAALGALTTTSSAATITVQSSATPPTITTQPLALTKTAGETATMTVVATGTAPLTYQWQTSMDGTTWTNVGTNSASYTTPVLTVADYGRLHRCIVSNAADSVTSSAPALTVNAVVLATTASITLTSDGVTPKANLAGLKWAFFDQSLPSLFAAPVAKGSAGSTNSSGVFAVSIAGTSLAPGAVGWLSVTDGDGSVSMAHSVFAGPVVVA